MRRRRKTITLDIDLGADLSGFGSARTDTPAHHTILKHYTSPWLLGPPPSDTLLEWVMHIYTEDEADLVRMLPPWHPRTAARVAKLTGRSEHNVSTVLDRLSDVKQVIVAWGEPRWYTILPVVPGTFELALITTDFTSRNRWHKKFAELFERLWESGYVADYVNLGHAAVRYLPVRGAAKTLYKAWPSDHLEEILEPHYQFAIGSCQCRMAMQLVGKGCDKPLENCTSIGPIAEWFIDRGMMRRADRAEVLETKRKAEEHGCVTWMMNEFGTAEGNVSCSCCGCCCHALRTLSELSAPGAISKPHFLPRKIVDRCQSCKKCTMVCPTDAWIVVGEQLAFQRIRCVGCGLCVVGCKFGALELVPVADAAPPEDSWLKLFAKIAPGFAANSARVFTQRLFGMKPPSPV